MATTKDALTGDPLVGAHFKVDVSGKATGFFTEVSGIGSETQVIEHKITLEQQGTGLIRKIPGLLKWNDITLKRGITANMDFYDWRKLVEQGKVDQARVSVTITMMAQDYTPIAEWTLENAWPSKITGPSIKADANEIGIEELTIVHEGITRTM
jgi:phage tail-like protein